MFTLLYVLFFSPTITFDNIGITVILGFAGMIEVGLIEFPLLYYFFVIRKTNQREVALTLHKLRKQEKSIKKFKR